MSKIIYKYPIKSEKERFFIKVPKYAEVFSAAGVEKMEKTQFNTRGNGAAAVYAIVEKDAPASQKLEVLCYNTGDTIEEELMNKIELGNFKFLGTFGENKEKHIWVEIEKVNLLDVFTDMFTNKSRKEKEEEK